MTRPAGASESGAASSTVDPPVIPAALSDVDWQNLHDLALEAMTHAYAPYSRFKVGAAALVDDGRLVSGCNVENASYGVTLCAECGLVSELIRTGGGRLVAFVCVDAHGRACAPCGRCRQLLSEHAAEGMVLAMPAGVMSIDKVLPDRFTAADVERVVGQCS